ncbi:hypothetical protein EG833_03310 [archaeon]|nr:hypothetical protein [archaeon]
MINSYLINKGNREYEASFKHLIDVLQRQRKVLLKYVSKVARHEQKVRYFNAIYNMDSQLRSMDNKDALQKHLKFRHHRMGTPVVYDIGEGPEKGDILNVDGDGLLLKTQEKVTKDHEVCVSVSGKSARGKVRWSLVDDSGAVETGVKLVEVSDEFLDEVKQHLKDEA